MSAKRARRREAETWGRLERELGCRTVEPKSCYQTLRQLPLTYLPCEMDDPVDLHRALVAGLCELGRLSVPLAVGVTMHLYTLAAVATFPDRHLPMVKWKRRSFLNKVRRRKWLVASCGSFRTHRRNHEAQATIEGDKFILSGVKDYVSLAGVADLILVGIETQEGHVLVFLIEGQDPRLRFGEPAFNDSMRLASTTSLHFDDVVLERSEVLFSVPKRGTDDFISLFQRTWFQSLVPAPYLGGGQAALDVLCGHEASHSFLRDRDDRVVLDGALPEIGRACADLEAARLLVERLGESLAKAARDGEADVACRQSAVAKSVATRMSLKVVQRLFQAMGTDAARPDSRIEELLQQAAVGPLHPVTEFELLRTLGMSRAGSNRGGSEPAKTPPGASLVPTSS